MCPIEQELSTLSIAAGKTLRIDSPGGSTFLCEIKLWPHLENVTSNRKSDSVSRCEFTWRTILPNFIPIRFETTEPWVFWRDRPNKKNNKNKMSTDGVRIIDVWNSRLRIVVKQDSWAIAKTTARCAQYMGARKISRVLTIPRLLFPKFVTGVYSKERAHKTGSS